MMRTCTWTLRLRIIICNDDEDDIVEKDDEPSLTIYTKIPLMLAVIQTKAI